MGTVRLLLTTLLITLPFMTSIQLVFERVISLVVTSFSNSSSNGGGGGGGAYGFSCAVGYSGILFAYMVISTKYEPWDRNLFGIFQMSAAVYPWVLLLITSLLFPGVSFLGHLSGLLSGYCVLYFVLNRSWFHSVVVAIEKRVPSRLLHIRSYYVSSDMMHEGGFNIGGSGGASSASGGGSSLSLQSIRSGLTGMRDSVVVAWRRLRDRITGNQSYLPLSNSSPESQGVVLGGGSSVGGGSNTGNSRDPAYWDNAGQGRTLGTDFR